MSEPAGVPLFVYGTLRRGEIGAELLGRARYLGPARTAPAFELVDLDEYPALVRGGTLAVVGELYEADPKTLASVDAYEGCPALFTRESIEIEGGGTCEAYLMRSDQTLGRPRISSGDWTSRGG